VRIWDAGLKCAARGSLKIQDAKVRHLRTVAQICRDISSQRTHVSRIEKQLLNINIFCIRPHNTVNFGLLTAEICWRVWGTPANFNGFHVLALLHRRRTTEVNQTLHDIWPSPGLVFWMYMFGGSCLLTKFRQVQNSLYVQVLRYCVARSLCGS